MAGTNFHILVAVGDTLPNLVIHTASGEVGESRYHGDLASGSQASSHAHHIGFRDAALYEAVWVGIDEIIGFHRAAQVGREHDYIIVQLTRCLDACTEAIASSFFARRLNIVEGHIFLIKRAL